METLFSHDGIVIRDENVLRFLDAVNPQELEKITKIILLGFEAGISAAHEIRLEKRAWKSYNKC